MIKEIDHLCTHPDATLLEVMKIIDRGGKGLALMTDRDGRLKGIITDGDVRREILRSGSLDSVASRCAKSDFKWVDSTASAGEVLEMMVEKNIKQVPVIDHDGRLKGLIEIQSLLRGEERPNVAVILAGGRGVRMRPMTDLLPKPMVPVGNRPLLERIVTHLRIHGIHRIFLAINYLGEMIEDYFGDGSRFGCRIEYIREDIPLGTAGSVRLLPEQPKHPLLVMNGDLLTGLNVGRVIEAHGDRGAEMTVVTREEGFQIPYGVVTVTDGMITGIDEKPTMKYRVNTGIYVLSPSILDYIPPNQFYPMTHLLDTCLREGRRVAAHEMSEYWKDIGSTSEANSTSTLDEAIR